MQRHVIKRQVIELTLPDRASAQPIQEEVSRIYQQRIVPLLDQICTDLSAPDTIHRIDSLTIDLGTLDSRHLERDIMARLHEALYEALAEAIAQPDGEQPASDTPARSNLELLIFFVRTGTLPWWVDSDQSDPLAAALADLLATAPAALRTALRTMARSETELRRLIGAFDDAALGQMVLLLSPGQPETMVRNLAALADRLMATLDRPAYAIRRRFWLAALFSAAQQVDYAPGAFYRAIVVQVAQDFGIDYPLLAQALERAVPASAMGEPLAAIVRSLRELPPDTPETVSAGRPVASALERLHDPTLPQVHELASLLLESAALAPAERAFLADVLRLDAAALTPALLARLGTIAERHSDSPSADLSFSETDAIYVHNAGLVILWPFLPGLFGNLGLVHERAFVDEVARQRAVALLQYLVHPAAPVVEYLLPLNKVLCGLDLAAVFEPGDPLTAEEIAEAAVFLEAVIAQAPILNAMSVDGFRGSFLLRRGMLSTRDGVWLLRVERETYDLVLDRFPWSWPWVRLPWMAEPLQVEW